MRWMSTDTKHELRDYPAHHKPWSPLEFSIYAQKRLFLSFKITSDVPLFTILALYGLRIVCMILFWFGQGFIQEHEKLSAVLICGVY